MPRFERIAGTQPPLDQIAHEVASFGEGPVWDQRKQYFLWVDIIGDTVWEWCQHVGQKALVHPSSHANRRGIRYAKTGW